MENLRRNYSGFTFIEIISVLIITSMLFGISAAVGTGILEKSKQERIIFNMYRDISTLRNEGIYTLNQTRVRFYKNYNNTGQSAYVLQTMENNIWKTNKRIMFDKNLKIFSLTFPGGVTNQNFSNKGIPLYTGSVGLSGSKGELYYLVFYNSGRIRVKEGA